MKTSKVKTTTKCGTCGGACKKNYPDGICRHCLPPDVPAEPGKTLCAECASDDQICSECGYPLGS